MDKRERGLHGETMALEYLVNKGYTLLCRNARFGHDEIDLILKDGEIIVFAEVKSRSSTAFGLGREAVDHKKQQRMVRAAQAFLLAQEQEVQIRFDVLEVDLRSGAIEHIPDAFMAET